MVTQSRPQRRQPKVDKQQQIEQQAQPDSLIARIVPFLMGMRIYPFYLLGGNFRGVNPDEIGFDVYAKIRQYPTIKFALNLIKTPILSRIKQATVECPDPSIKRAVEHVFLESGLLYRLTKQMLRALDFGISANEKLWHVENVDLTYDYTDEDGVVSDESAWKGPILLIKDFVEINPLTVSEIRRRYEPKDGKPGDGSFDGLIVNTGDGEKTIEPAKCFVHTNEKEFGNLWGQPVTKPAFPYWTWAQVIANLAMAWAERKVAPTRLARFPQGIDKDTKKDNQQTAIWIGNSMDNVGTTALPSDVDPASGKYKWDVQEFALTDKTTIFDALLKWCDQMMLWAIGVPQRVFMEAQYGTRAEAETFTDTFLLTLDTRVFDISDDVNQYGVDPFVLVNFGEDAPKARIQVPGITDQHRAMLRQILMLGMTNPDVLARIDFDAIAHSFNVELKDIEPTQPENMPQPGEIPPGTLPPQTTPPNAPNQPTPPTNPPEGGQPGNLVLNDDESFALYLEDDITFIASLDDDAIIELEDAMVELAAGFDPSRWEVTPDANSILKYKVWDKQYERRVSGSYGAKVVESFLKWQSGQSKSAAKKAESEAKKAANKAASEAKKQAAAAQRASQKQERDAIRAQKAAEREAVKQQKAQTAAQKKQQAAEIKAQKEAQRKALQEQRAQATAQRKQQTQENQTANSQLSQARNEKLTMQRFTSKQTADAAAQTVEQNGWQVVTQSADAGAALKSAQDAAGQDNDHIYTVVQHKGGATVVRKARKDLTQKAPTQRNIAASEESKNLDSTEIFLDAPNQNVAELWEEAQSVLKQLGMPENADESEDEE